MSVINILMQLRKVCNHPNMFEERPTVSSFRMEGIKFITASLVNEAIKYDPYRVSYCLLISNDYMGVSSSVSGLIREILKSKESRKHQICPSNLKMAFFFLITNFST